MDVTNKLNEKLHRVETLYEQAKSKKLIDVNDIGRMKDCFENLICRLKMGKHTAPLLDVYHKFIMGLLTSKNLP